MYRRNRRLVLQDDTEDINAVRVNIPLSRVLTVDKSEIVSFAGLITVTFDPKATNNASHEPSTQSSTDDNGGLALIDAAPEKQVLQFGILRKHLEWEDVMSYVAKAKTPTSSSNVDWPGSRVYIDVDPQANGACETSDSNLSDLVKSVSLTLGMDTSKEIWGPFCLFFPSRSRLIYFFSLQFAKPASIAPS